MTTAMSRIGQLLCVVAPPMITSELPSDLIEMPCKYARAHLCLKCRICGAVSGTSRKISHSYDCRYAARRDMGGPFVLGERRRAATEMTLGSSEAILQHECGFVSPYSIKTTLATYGAGPCVILAMYDRQRRTAGLAHIDARTRDPVQRFRGFPPSSDVYIVGGDRHSHQTLLSTLSALREHGFEVTFAHVMDDESNSFAIDCLTGETWLNSEVALGRMKVSVNKSFRERMLDVRALTSVPLAVVKVPVAW